MAGARAEVRAEACAFSGTEQLKDGAVQRVETWVGPLRSRESCDLGAVSAPRCRPPAYSRFREA